MSDHESTEGASLEAALRQLTPLPATFDRDRVLFRAGQASGRRARWRLALLAALVGAGSGMAGAYLGVPRAPDVPPRIIVVHVPTPVPEAPAPGESANNPPNVTPVTSSERDSLIHLVTPANGYLHLRDQALRWGVEALPMPVPTSPGGPAPEPTNMRKMQSEWVGNATDL